METHLSIKIPKGLMDMIDEEVERDNYSSRSDFVKAAIRAHLQQIADARTSPGGITAQEKSTSSERI